jgi:hypothetical protein
MKAGHGAVCGIPYPQAAIWDLMSRSYDYETIVAMMGHIAAVSADEARSLAQSALHTWTDAGLLVREDGRG